MKQHSYHYCAQYEQKTTITRIDGIAQLNNKILTMDDYKQLKELIDCPNIQILTISSLTYLGVEE